MIRESWQKTTPAATRRRHFFPLLAPAAALFLFSAAASGQPTAPEDAAAHRHRQSFRAPREWSRLGVAAVGEPGEKPGKENFVRGRKYEGFFVYREGSGYRIFFTERRTKRTYEIRGVGQSHRPLAGLKWAGDTLVFDSWSNPHGGVHYEFDARRRRLKKVLIFRDQE